MRGFIAVAALSVAGIAQAQSGHFVGTPTCTDIGTQVVCTGKVAGLGGTTFNLVVSASGTGIVECENPGGNVAPGQNTTVDASGGTGNLATPRNGAFNFRGTTLATIAPVAPAGTCPNRSWTAHIVDVVFSGQATIILFEDSIESDRISVPIVVPN